MIDPIIGVAIGLILIFLLLGLIAAALQEIVARVLQWRGKELKEGLENLLEAGTNPGAFQRIYQHPLVTSSAASGRLPSYLSAQNFAIALSDSLRNNSGATVIGQIEQSIQALPPRPKRALEALLRDAGGSYEVFRWRVERWFDDSMDRVSGSYKRRSQTFALIFGLAVAVLLNVDSIGIGRSLWMDPQRRQVVVQSAELYLQPHPATAAASTSPNASADAASDAQHLKAAIDELNQLPLPIGWTIDSAQDQSTWDAVVRVLLHSGWGGPLKVIGWLVTALAVSLGAPFWFDTLQKFLNIRGAGPAPARSSR